MTFDPKNPLDTFDPNDMEVSPWASYCPSRYPSFKVHKSRRALLNGVGGTPQAIYYKFLNSRWAEIGRHDRVNHPAMQCEDCGKQESAAVKHWSSYGRDIRMVWRKQARKVADPPTLVGLCHHCRLRNES